METVYAAVDHAEKFNFSIIPIRPDKKPYIQWAEYQKRRAAADEIRNWWAKWPDAMIGIVTGQISGLFVVDCDSQPGYEAVQSFLPDSLEIPTVRTPRGGWHHYFRYPVRSNLTVQAAVMPGVDIRGEGGYIIAPPSRNADGKLYGWMENLSLAEVAPPLLPDALLSALYNIINNSLYRNDVKNEVTVSNMFDYGRRDNDLFHVGNCLVKGGMPKEEIAQVLEKLIISWGENPDNRWIRTKIESALQRADKREISFSQEVRDFVMTSNGFFLTSDVFSRLQVTSRQEKKNVVTSLLRLHKDGMIERHGNKDGCYRRVENDVEPVNFLTAPTDEFPLILPFGIDDYTVLYPGNIVIVAGSKSAGKTAFLLNIVKDNMQQHDVVYLNSEMGDTEFRKRLELFDLPLSNWKFRAYHRASNFSDLITSERKVFIIDFLEITTDFWKVAQYIQEIHKKLKDGICIIALQKSEGRDSGRGGDFSKEKSRLYLGLDYIHDKKVNQVKIIDAKAWRTDNNPRGMYRHYKLVNGARYFPASDWMG